MTDEKMKRDLAEEDLPEAADIDEDFEARLKALEDAENAIDWAYSTGKAERSKITQAAQLDAAEAVALAGIAMEADAVADEAMRLSVIADRGKDVAAARTAHKKARDARRKARIDHSAATRAARDAYQAIKFSAPNSLGFLRVVQVIFAIQIAAELLYLLLTSRDAIIYNASTIVSWFLIIFEGIAFWFLINRYKIARPFIIGMSIFCIVVPIIAGLIVPPIDRFTVTTNVIFFGFLIIYFALSRRVKATLVNDLSKHKGEFENGRLVIKRWSWPFFRNLIMYFIVFSLLGHWMEAGMCQFIIMGWVQGEYDPTNTMLWRDWLYPYPMEGMAVVLIALVLYPFKEWLDKQFKNPIWPYVISFFANALMCTAIEFFMGLIVNADLQLWDYTDNFGNIMGQVCLQNTLAFGVAASIIAWFVYPMLEYWIARARQDVMNIVFVAVLVFGGILWSLYIVDPPENPALIVEDMESEDVQRDVVNLALSSLNSDLDLLENTLEDSDKLDTAASLEEIDAMRLKIRQIQDDLGIEELLNFDTLGDDSTDGQSTQSDQTVGQAQQDGQTAVQSQQDGQSAGQNSTDTEQAEQPAEAS